MNVEKKENIKIDSYKLEIIKISSTDKPESADVVSKQYVDRIVKNNSDKLEHFEKLTMILIDCIKKIEKEIALKEVAGKLSKHYEQSRRR